MPLRTRRPSSKRPVTTSTAVATSEPDPNVRVRRIRDSKVQVRPHIVSLATETHPPTIPDSRGRIHRLAWRRERDGSQRLSSHPGGYDPILSTEIVLLIRPTAPR